MAADVVLRDHGSLVGMTPTSDAARDWMREHIPAEAMWFGGALMVEPRYVEGIEDGMACDGLELEWSAR